jgi:hypothetical protein
MRPSEYIEKIASGGEELKIAPVHDSFLIQSRVAEIEDSKLYEKLKRCPLAQRQGNTDSWLWLGTEESLKQFLGIEI